MFYRAYGAKDVDSFDISYCAKAMMDMKTAAIRKMDLREYYKFIHKVYHAKNLDFCSDIVSSTPFQIRNFIKDIEDLAKEESIEVKCEFCNTVYTYNKADLEKVLSYAKYKDR